MRKMPAESYVQLIPRSGRNGIYCHAASRPCRTAGNQVMLLNGATSTPPQIKTSRKGMRLGLGLRLRRLDPRPAGPGTCLLLMLMKAAGETQRILEMS